MSLWQRYIKWIDAELGQGWPRMGGISSLVFLAPVSIAIAYSVILAPEAKPGMLEAILVIAPTLLLFGVWAWRAYLCAMRQARQIGAGEDRDRE